jgi:glycosyltransferase involved in cell wall biosynthesis
MSAVSVVIITKNEEKNIVDCIRSAQLLSDDVVVVDCGSDDETVSLAQKAGARAFEIEWKGFGFSRNFGAEKANNSWIFSLDADERITPELASVIKELQLNSKDQVFRFRRINYFAGTEIRFGTLGFEKVSRVYNRNHCYWDFTQVHEKLISSKDFTTIKIGGFITHFGLKNYEDFRQKSVLYAQLSAEKYIDEGRKPNALKRYASPLFNSFKSYIFQFGFLEGRQGFMMAKMIAHYSWLKYNYLHKFSKHKVQIKEFRAPLQAAKTA